MFPLNLTKSEKLQVTNFFEPEKSLNLGHSLFQFLEFLVCKHSEEDKQNKQNFILVLQLAIHFGHNPLVEHRLYLLNFYSTKKQIM